MSWKDGLDLWRRLDGSVLFGFCVYLYLSRRNERRRHRRAVQIALEQEAAIALLIATARQRGILLWDPRESADEPQSLH